jgi:hypothetical protein
MLWKMVREIKSPRPLCRKQEFYYASRLRGDKVSKPWAPISVRRWVIYPWEGYAARGFLQYMGQLQEDKLVTEFATPTPL